MCSMIWDDSPYVDAFGKPGTQLYCKGAIDVNMFNSVRSRMSYSQLSWVVHLLQNFLTQSIVILTSLLICTMKVLTSCSRRATIACQSATSGMFKNMSLLKARAPGMLPIVVVMVVCMACIAIAEA